MHNASIFAVQGTTFGSNKEAVPSAASLPPSSAEPTYVQFTTAGGQVIASASGQSWFAASAASATIQHGNNSTFLPIGLALSLGNDAPSAALDADLAAGTAINAEVAVYNANGSAVQADYVFSNTAVSLHSNDPAEATQAFAFSGGNFQESIYAAGQTTSALSYDAATNTTTMSAVRTSGAPATAPTNAPAATDSDTYVQFLDGAGQAIAGSGGRTWFQVPSQVANLSATSGGGTNLGALAVQIGDDQIAGNLDAAALTNTGLSTVNVASFANGALQTYQRFTGAAVTGATTSNTGSDHSYTLSYSGYGESMPNATPLSTPATASAGTNASVPSARTTLPLA